MIREKQKNVRGYPLYSDLANLTHLVQIIGIIMWASRCAITADVIKLQVASVSGPLRNLKLMMMLRDC